MLICQNITIFRYQTLYVAIFRFSIHGTLILSRNDKTVGKSLLLFTTEGHFHIQQSIAIKELQLFTYHSVFVRGMTALQIHTINLRM